MLPGDSNVCSQATTGVWDSELRHHPCRCAATAAWRGPDPGLMPPVCVQAQALRARLQLRERECESLRGRVAGAGALSASEKRQAQQALEAAAQQRAVLERQLSEAQAKVQLPLATCCERQLMQSQAKAWNIVECVVLERQLSDAQAKVQNLVVDICLEPLQIRPRV